MARLSASVPLADPETGEAKVFLAGSELPAWAEGKVGKHLVEETSEKSVSVDEESPYDGMTNAQLRDEIVNRNLLRPEDDQLPEEGKKTDLLASLERDDSER